MSDFLLQGRDAQWLVLSYCRTNKRRCVPRAWPWVRTGCMVRMHKEVPLPSLCIGACVSRSFVPRTASDPRVHINSFHVISATCTRGSSLYDDGNGVRGGGKRDSPAGFVDEKTRKRTAPPGPGPAPGPAPAPERNDSGQRLTRLSHKGLRTSPQISNVVYALVAHSHGLCTRKTKSEREQQSGN